MLPGRAAKPTRWFSSPCEDDVRHRTAREDGDPEVGDRPGDVDAVDELGARVAGVAGRRVAVVGDLALAVAGVAAVGAGAA